MILDIAVFFGVLAILILAHEFGHFFAARKNGVRVEEFGFGFPPRIFGVKKGETLYSFNLLPLGGFVKITGENETSSSNPDHFASKSILARSAILSAGVIFNLILAFVIFSSVIFIGMPVDAQAPFLTAGTRDVRITVVEILPDSAAEKAGLLSGDVILSMETETGAKIEPVNILEIQAFTGAYATQEIMIKINRNGESQVLSALLGDGEAPLGIAMAEIGIIDAPWYKVPLVGLELTVTAVWRMFQGIFFILALLFSGSSVAGVVSGPVGIFSIVSGTLDFGFPVLMSLVAILSVNLAIINLIPIPGLDGGRLLFLGIEALRGRPVGQKISGFAHAAGFAFLIILMVVITYLDIKSGL